MEAALDAVGRAQRRAVARGRADLRGRRGRCLLRGRAPPRPQGSSENPRIPGGRARPLSILPRGEEKMQTPNTYRGGPDPRGHFGLYGGRYVAETLMPLILAVEAAYNAAKDDPNFHAELAYYLDHYVGRPSPLYFAERLTRHFGGAKIYFKRDELNHTGAHKINNVLGQVLLATRMGKRRIIAETGAGQHGVATATACALFDLECVVYMGTEDMRRQKPNVERMGLLGARVEPVNDGARTLKEAVSAAIRDWVANVETTHYIIGSCVGPAPYPALVRDLQRVIGDEARAQIQERTGRLPQRVIACVGGGSNSIGVFIPFVGDADVRLIGVEAAGDGLESGRHGAPLTAAGLPGVLHGAFSAVMQDEDGPILDAP